MCQKNSTLKKSISFNYFDSCLVESEKKKVEHVYMPHTDNFFFHLTPFLMFVSHRRDIFRRSKSLMSPLSYPAQTQRS